MDILYRYSCMCVCMRMCTFIDQWHVLNSVPKPGVLASGNAEVPSAAATSPVSVVATTATKDVDQVLANQAPKINDLNSVSSTGVLATDNTKAPSAAPTGQVSVVAATTINDVDQGLANQA